MNGGQITMLVLFGLSLGCNLAQHGKPRTGTNNFWKALLSIAIEVCVLWWGGFWN